MTGREEHPGSKVTGEGEARSPPPVAVIILTFEGRDLIECCLESVLRSTYPNLRVVVVDNGSRDGTPDLVAERFPTVDLIRLPENRGFSTAYNEAVARAGEPFLVLLNQDTEVATPDWIERLVEVATSEGDCAVVAAKILFRDAPHKVNSLGVMAYWWTTPVDIGFGENDPDSLPEGFEPFAGSGGAMLIRRDRFLEVGGFDEAFFMYCEDIDLGWRLRLRGNRTLLAEDARVLHDFSPGLGRLSPRKVYLVHRNYLRAMLKNYEAVSLLRGLPQFLLFTALKSIGLGVRLRSLRLVWAPWRAVGWNLLVLRDTWARRRRIQRARQVPDRVILAQMGDRGFEPLVSLRRRLKIAEADGS